MQSALFRVYDLWRDAERLPKAGEIPIVARIARVCGLAVLFASLGGSELARTQLRERAGGMLDPGMVDAFDSEAMSGSPSWARPTCTKPCWRPSRLRTCWPQRLGRVARVFADLADLKSPPLTGHSRGVASLAASAGARLTLDDHAVADLEVAGLLHDVGRVAVSSAVWDKPSRLTPGEWEQARLHPYHTERDLSFEIGALLAGASLLAVLHDDDSACDRARALVHARLKR